jgi:HTH-type transcriptional regulator/antitoxin HigA
MTRPIANEYAPDSMSPPGETLQELLEERGMSQAQLAERTGRPKKTINEIVHGKAAITPETALQLERVLGVPANFWSNREANYREHLARKEEQHHLSKRIGWLKELPLAFMIKKGWIRKHTNKVEQLREVLMFFGVSSPAEWGHVFEGQRAYFRQSSAFEIHRGSVAAWLRQGEIQARLNAAEPFDKDTFVSMLQDVRPFTKESPQVFEAALPALCAKAGVVAVFVPAPKGCRASGATRWVSKSKALIQLSLRYKTDDHLWFTFFHEAGHLVKHGKKEVFLETNKRAQGVKEDEANRFAADLLTPPDDFRNFVKRSEFTKAAIIEFANAIDIAPGIVVGRLQHEKLLQWNSNCNDLKKHFRWKDQ